MCWSTDEKWLLEDERRGEEAAPRLEQEVETDLPEPEIVEEPDRELVRS